MHCGLWNMDHASNLFWNSCILPLCFFAILPWLPIIPLRAWTGLLQRNTHVYWRIASNTDILWARHAILVPQEQEEDCLTSPTTVCVRAKWQVTLGQVPAYEVIFISTLGFLRRSGCFRLVIFPGISGLIHYKTWAWTRQRKAIHVALAKTWFCSKDL